MVYLIMNELAFFLVEPKNNLYVLAVAVVFRKPFLEILLAFVKYLP